MSEKKDSRIIRINRFKIRRLMREIENVSLCEAFFNNLKLFKLFLKGGGIDPNQKNSYGYTPLYYAIKYKNVDAIQLLIKYGADVNFQHYDADTPLIYSMELGDEKITELLIDGKADINQPSKYHLPPIIKAMYSTNSNIAKLLIEKKCDVNATAPSGNSKYTALHIAVKQNQQYVKMLLDGKADVDPETKYGKTPLIEALYEEKLNKEIVEMLINNGANLLKKDRSNGETPLSLAEYHSTHGNNKNVYELMEKISNKK